MKIILQAAVFILMVSVGMSLRPRQLLDNWRRLSPLRWVQLLAATFLLPPLLALALGTLLPLDGPAIAGLFLVAVAPGAPLMTYGVSKKGFDRQVAASYQVWGALLSPLMIPLLVAAGGWLYGRDIWVPPLSLLAVIAQQQFAPLLLGLGLMWLAPAFSTRIQRLLNVLGNGIILILFAAVLFKLGPALLHANPWVALATPLLAVGCLLAVPLLMGRRFPLVPTLSICNANRHAGLALLLAGQHLQDTRPVPTIAAYAIAAIVVMALYARFAPPPRAEPTPTTQPPTPSP